MTNPNTETITSTSYITGITVLYSDSYIRNTMQSLDSYSVIVDRPSTIICEGEIIDEILGDFGVQVVIRVITKTFSSVNNPYVLKTETYSDHVITVLMQSFTSEESQVKEGIFHDGELVVQIKVQDEAYAVIGNRISYAGNWYEISRVVKTPMGGYTYIIQATLKKV